MPHMILLRSRRVELAVASLFLFPFGAAKLPGSNDGSASYGLHSDINARASDSAGRRRFTRNSSSLSNYHNIASRSRGNDKPSYNRSRLSEPSLPEYAFEGVASESHPRVYVDERTKAARQFSDTEPHVSELEGDTDNIWSRHDVPHDASAVCEAEIELPHENHDEELAHSPIVYQYFGRSRSRVHTADSIPFILLGPTVDHWKTVGQTMASRGFSVMACEVVDEGNKGRRKQTIPEEGKNLILAVLDALRWNRAILVGCDSEAAMAIEAAIQLAPDRVAGLVLCGDLSSADQLARKEASADTEQRPTRSQREDDSKRHTALDSLLKKYLKCPYAIVWDGDVAQSPSPPTDSSTYSISTGDMFAFNRCLILGGGTAPHRRVPEQFAWALTRFVEEKVAPRSVPLMIQSQMSIYDSASQKRRGVWRDSLPLGLEEFFSPGSMLVLGRLFASAIFYMTAMKIAVYQYDNLRGGVIGIHSLVQWLRSGKEHIFSSTASFVRNYGYVFSLFRPSHRGELVLDYNSMDDNEMKATENDVQQEEEKEPKDNPCDEEDQDDMDEDDHNSDKGAEPETREGERDIEMPQRLILLDLVVV